MKEITYLIEWSHPGRYICHFRYSFTFLFITQPQSKSTGKLVRQEGQKFINFFKMFFFLQGSDPKVSNPKSKPNSNNYISFTDRYLVASIS